MKMRQLILALFVCSSHCLAETTAATDGYKASLDAFVKRLPPDQQIEPGRRSSDWMQSSDFQELASLTPKIWRDLLDNIPSIASDPASRTVLLKTLTVMPPQEYVSMLDTALDLYQSNKISSLEYERLFFASGSLRFFLSYNYQHPEVAALLERIKQARVSETIASNIEDYISGRQQQRDIYLRKTHSSLSGPVPLLSGGFAPPDPEPSLTPDPMSAPLGQPEPHESANSLHLPDSALRDRPVGSDLLNSSTPSTNAESSHGSLSVMIAGAIVLSLIVGLGFFLMRKRIF